MTSPKASVIAAGVAVVALGGAATMLLTSRPAPSAPPAVAPVDGQTLFQLKGCARCHDGPDSTADVGIGPPLVDAATWAGTRRAGVSAPDYVRESILAPHAFVAPSSSGWEMPTLTLTAEEVEHLVSYVLEG
jgi:mono/diheme cytochrome c family protein